MFKRLFVVVLLSAVGTIGPAKSQDGPSPYFKGVNMMSYSLANGTQGRCAIDQKAWDTAIDFIANQSVKLKLITYRDNLDLYGAARKAGKEWVWIPLINSSMDSIDVVTGCAGHVQTEVDAYVRCGDSPSSSCKIDGSDQTMLFHTVKIWSSSYLIKGPYGDFSSYTIQTSEQLLKKLVNDWAKAQE